MKEFAQIVCNIHVTTKCIWLGSVIFYENYSISVKIDFIRQSTACSLKKHHVYFAFIFGNQFWGFFLKGNSCLIQL